ncbi:MAG: glycoside hydrolase, partial [Pseudomonadota bacterium]|nr:glycoside hydrolase [Pseudomonadota bacterium]
KAWTSTDAGKSFREQVLGQAEGDNDFPRLVRHGERMVVVWRNSKEVKVHDIGF